MGEGKKKKKHPGGRPTVMTEKTLNKLETGFMMGFNVLECCLYADISTQTYYDYINKHEEFSDKIKLLKQNVSMQAKANIAMSIAEGNKEDSKWHLERRNRQEYSLKSESDTNNETKIEFKTVRITNKQKEQTKDERPEEQEQILNEDAYWNDQEEDWSDADNDDWEDWDDDES